MWFIFKPAIFDTFYPHEVAIYINFIKFKSKICRDLRTFHGVKFGLKDLLCVKDMTLT